MKKIVILLVFLLALSACNYKDEKKDVVEDNKMVIDEPKIEEYVDNNNTPIGIYDEKGGKLELVQDYKTSIEYEKDIVVFNIYPSLDSTLYINGRYGVDFYNKWISIENHENLKIGFNIKYTLDTGEQVSYNILEPKDAINYDKLIILSWLYDDYANRNSDWYSHIEQEEYNEDTLYTAIKIYATDDARGITSKITLTVFTYDGLDDFDENNEYRGNSKHSIVICDIGKTC